MRTRIQAKNTRAGTRILALIFAALLTGALSLTPALAYIPEQLQPALGTSAPQPAVTASLTVKNQAAASDGTEKSQIDYGDPIQYQGTLELTNAQVSGDMQIYVSINPSAVSFAAPLSTANLQWSIPPASVSGPVAADGAFVYTASGVQPGTTVSFSANAKVTAESVPGATPGTLVYGSLKGVYTPTGLDSKLRLAAAMAGEPFLRQNGSCYAVITAKSNPLLEGAWLADIKFGDLSGQQNVRFVNDKFIYSTQSPSLTTDANGNVISTGDSIAISSPGQDPATETNAALAQSSFYPVDNYPPTIVPMLPADAAKAKFLDSLNWPYDVSTMTGKVWLPQGTTLQLSRVVEIKNCSTDPADEASAAEIASKMLYYVELGRPNLPASGLASAQFTLPGGKPQKTDCNTVYWLQSLFPTQQAPTAIGGFDNPITSKPMISSSPTLDIPPSQPTGTLAISPLEPDRFYYIDDAAEVTRYIESATGKVGLFNAQVTNEGIVDNANTFQLFQAAQRDPFAAAFDKHGVLWAWGEGTSGRNMSLWSLDVTNPSATWQQRVSFVYPYSLSNSNQNWGKNKVLIYDIAFDADDNLYAVQGTPRGGIVNRSLLKIPAQVIANAQQSGQPINLLTTNTEIANQQFNVLQGADYPYIFAGWQNSFGLQGNPAGVGSAFGLAFGPDNQLWVAFGPNNTGGLAQMTPILAKVDMSQIQVGSTQQVTLTPYEVYNQQDASDSSAQDGYPYMFSDLASCASLQPPTPAFEVQKSAVDPVTGQVQPAGSAAPNKLEMSENQRSILLNGKMQRVVEGQATFYVTVTNTGEGAGATTIDDTLNLGSEEFYVHALSVDGKPAVGANGAGIVLDKNNVSFQLQTEQLQPGQQQTFVIVADIVSTNILSNDLGNIGQCQMASGDAVDYGIFNSVTMENDKDGADNNQACIAVGTKDNGQLFLYKGIENPDGTQNSGAFYDPGQPNATIFVNGDKAQSVAQFELGAAASGLPSFAGHMSEVAGAATTTWSPVGGAVVAGTYQLTEEPENAAAAADFHQVQGYNCYADGQTQAIAENATAVTVAAGQTVRCYVVNSYEQQTGSIVLRKMDANAQDTGLGLNGAEFQICDQQPEFTDTGALSPGMTSGSEPACKPLKLMTQVAGAALGTGSADFWATNYATYGKVCDQYLPAGVTVPAYADRYNYGAPFAACIDQYAGTKNGGMVSENLTDGSLFYLQGLPLGEEYWIVETKAPLCDRQQASGNSAYCYSLLPQPLYFKLNTDGVLSAYGQAAGAQTSSWSTPSATACNPFAGACQPQVSVDKVGDIAAYDIYRNAIIVHDPRQGELPKAGGNEHVPFGLLGVATLALALAYGTFRLLRRH